MFENYPDQTQPAQQPQSQYQPEADSAPNYPQYSSQYPPESNYDPNSAAELDFVPPEYRPRAERLLLEWQAPSRPYKQRNRKYYTTVTIIVVLISLILFFAGQLLPIAVVIAIAFLAYVLSAVPPETVLNRVTTYGIYTDKSVFYWEEMGRFWFSERYGQKMVHIETTRLPNQITLLLGDQTEEGITAVLSQVLLQEKPKPTAFEQAAAWLQEKIPLDTEA